MARGRVAVGLGGELGILQPDIGRHALGGVSPGQVEHRVVQGVEAGQGDELELVPHLAEFALELLDGAVVEVLAPVEGRRAVVGQQLVRVPRVDGIGELPRLIQVRGGGLHPEQVRVRRVREAAGDAGRDAVAHPEEALRRPVASDERPVALVHVAGDQRGGVRVGAGHDERRHAADVGGQARGVQCLDVLPGRDEHLPAEVAALLLGRKLVLPVHARRARRDHRLHQLERVQHAAEARLSVGHDRRQPVRLARRCRRPTLTR